MDHPGVFVIAEGLVIVEGVVVNVCLGCIGAEGEEPLGGSDMGRGEVNGECGDVAVKVVLQRLC